ncbi:hypothetical protein [Endozoicomonas atrinae]|uniref:hypothetical protein n=1 Tax=Endozoicomonas atrinae TaxID=1333660 RepID=UPI000825243D|nr:hypothetical protein [Endozoicomonas atrinae]
MPFPTINHFASHTERREEVKRFCGLFEKVAACHAVDNIPRNVNRMNPGIRQQHITDRQAELVSVKQSVRTGFFEFEDSLSAGEGGGKKINERERLKVFMGHVICKGVYKPELNACVEHFSPDSDPVVFPKDCIAKGPPGIQGDNSIDLTTPEMLSVGDRIGIYNNDDYLRVVISYKDIDPVILKSWEGAIFDAVAMPDSELSWRFVAHYRRNENEMVEMNPLLREDGESLGEFFLPPDGVQDIVGANRDDGFKPPLYHYSGDYKDYSALKKGVAEYFIGENYQYSPFSFVVMNDCDCHMVAVRLIKVGESAVVYIHEGLSPSGVEAKTTRAFVMECIKQELGDSFRDKVICLTTPVPGEGERLFQSDYRSCGTIAADAIIDFDKAGDESLDSWLVSIASRKDLSSWALVCQENGESDLNKSATKRQSGKINEFSIPIDFMHPLLVKHYQGGREKLRYSQLRTIIDNSGLTLKGYYEMLCQSKGGRNVSSAFWTYQYISFWTNMIETFQSISLEMSYKEVVSWLKKYHGFEISEFDWKQLKYYEIFVEEDLNLKDWNRCQFSKWAKSISRLAGWIDKISSPGKIEERARGFLYSWCWFINKNNKNGVEDVCNHWKNMRPEDLASEIKKAVDAVERNNYPHHGFHTGVLSELHGKEVKEGSSVDSRVPDSNEKDHMEERLVDAVKRKKVTPSPKKKRRKKDCVPDGKLLKNQHQDLVCSKMKKAPSSHRSKSNAEQVHKSSDSKEELNINRLKHQQAAELPASINTGQAMVKTEPCEDVISFNPGPEIECRNLLRGDHLPNLSSLTDVLVPNEAGGETAQKRKLVSESLHRGQKAFRRNEYFRESSTNPSNFPDQAKNIPWGGLLHERHDLQVDDSLSTPEELVKTYAAMHSPIREDIDGVTSEQYTVQPCTAIAERQQTLFPQPFLWGMGITPSLLVPVIVPGISTVCFLSVNNQQI